MKVDVYASLGGAFVLVNKCESETRARMFSKHLIYSNQAKTCLLIFPRARRHEYVHRGCVR